MNVNVKSNFKALMPAVYEYVHYWLRSDVLHEENEFRYRNVCYWAFYDFWFQEDGNITKSFGMGNTVSCETCYHGFIYLWNIESQVLF